jgi:phosphoribosyl 1,2-cyclic phosphodiesterase
VTDLLVTHGHSDHVDAAAVARLAGAPKRRAPLRLWATADSARSVGAVGGLQCHLLAPGQTTRIAGITVHTLPANHVVEDGGQAVHYLLEGQQQSLLYATDGAWLLKPVWQALQARPGTTIIWDATNGETQGDWRIFEHNSVDMVRLMLQTLRQQGIVDTDTPMFLTHMARTLCAPHQEMAARLAPEGLTPAYDGMAVPWDVGG